MPTHFSRNLWGLIAIFFLLCGFNGVKKKMLRIVFIGDSITYGAGVQDKEHFAPPAVVAGALRQMTLVEDVKFYNGGKSGATTLDFLPGTANFKRVLEAADRFYAEQQALSRSEKQSDLLLFSIMLGTNDSAIEGPNGAPVSAEQYQRNLKLMIDSLVGRYPDCRVVLQKAPWYSDNTYNGAKYLKQGQRRLVQYNPKIDELVRLYKKSTPDRVFAGDKSAYPFFKKNYKTTMVGENGRQGVFYLHPNKEGSIVLGKKWAKALHKAAMKTAL